MIAIMWDFTARDQDIGVGYACDVVLWLFDSECLPVSLPRASLLTRDSRLSRRHRRTTKKTEFPSVIPMPQIYDPCRERFGEMELR